MQRIASILLLTMLSTVTLLHAGDKKGDMTGWVCNSKCVVQEGEKNSCKKDCTETSGEAVFVDDKGQVFKIANQDKATANIGKHGKMKYKMEKEKDTMMMYNFEIAEPTY